MVNRDLNMLVLNGGRERTRKEYQALIEGAGLEMDGLIPLESGFSAIIGVKPGATTEPSHEGTTNEPRDLFVVPP